MPSFMVDDLRPFAIGILHAGGTTTEEAELITDHAIANMLAGEANHGIQLGTQYLPHVASGLLKPGSEITIEKETATTLLVDGNYNFGHYVSHHTMLRLIDKARTSHMAAASIKNQGHVGRLIDYTILAADAGMISIMMCDGAYGPKFMAPWGGTEKRLGVNPWSLAVPSDLEGPVAFDMTSGAVSASKIRRARAEGKQVPLGWITDRNGQPTTDPNEYYDGGSILPLGGELGHKGYVLNFMIELLADVLSGSDFISVPARGWPTLDACFMCVFDVSAFRPLDEFKKDVRGLVDFVKSSPPAPGSPGVFYPGERSAISAVEKRRTGVDIPQDVWEDIMSYAEKFDLLDTVPTPVQA